MDDSTISTSFRTSGSSKKSDSAATPTASPTAIAPYLTVTFHSVDDKDICKIAIDPAPETVYIDIRDKSGQLCETFFIRTGNSTNKLEKPSEITKYIKQRWG